MSAATVQAAHAQVAGEMRGAVTDAYSARPVQHATVELNGASYATRTGADGSYVLRGLEPRRYLLTVRAFGYAPFAYEVNVSNGRATVLDVSMHASPGKLNTVDVRSSRNAPYDGTQVFTRETIEQSGHRDLGELLQSVPGFVVTQAGGPGQPSTVSVRGSSARQLLVLIDGVPYNSELSGDADVSRVSLATVNRITIRTGAASARYGPRAMAGVIDIQTRRNDRELSGELRSGALGERGGSITGGVARELSALTAGASLTGDYQSTNGNFTFTLPAVRGGGETTRMNADATSRALVANAAIETRGVNATVRGNWQSTDRGMAGSIVQPSLTGRQRSDRESAGVDLGWNVHAIALAASTTATRERGTYIDRTPPFGEAYSDTINANGVTATASATLNSDFGTPSAGVEVRTLDVSSNSLASSAPRSQALTGAWVSIRTEHPLAKSLYRVSAEVSARTDWNSMTHDPAFSPRIATVISRSAVALSLSVGSGYAPPTLADQFFHEGVQVKANPALHAERTQADLEARISLRDTPVSIANVSGSVAAYRSDIDGMILWFPDFRFIWSPANYDVRRRGFEASGMLRFPGIHLELQGGGSVNSVTYAGNVLSGQVAYRPRTSDNVLVAFAPSFARVDLTTRYIGSRRTIAGSALNSLDPYWLTDVRISRTMQHAGWTVQPAATIENAFNRSAAMLVDYPFPSRTWTISVRVRRSSSLSTH